MKLRFLVLIFCFALLPSISHAQEETPEPQATIDITAEPTAEAAAEATTESIEFPDVGTFAVVQPHMDRQRRYVMTIPQSYAASSDPVPLVIALHPATSNGEQMMRLTNYNALAEAENFIVVYPDGVGGVWADGRIGDSRTVPGVDDVQFLAALIDTLASNLNIDANRVYVMGYSMGGMMAFRAGCALPTRIAAIGSVASTLPQYLLNECDALETPLPVIVIHGTNDSVIPWLGALTQQRSGYISLIDTAYFWASHNGCQDFSGITALDDIDPDDATRVLVERYTNCLNNADVEIVGVYRGGHTYPGYVSASGSTQGGLTSQDISATRATWEFMSNFSR